MSTTSLGLGISFIIGNFSVNEVPSSTLERTSIVPLCKSMIFLTQYKPKPVPIVESESGLFIRENLVNIFFWSFLSMPTPLSLMVMTV